MSSKHLLFRAEAREKILRGVSTLTDAVRVTLGPRSRCVLIEKKWGRPIVCNDGVTIAKEIELKDPEENLGAKFLRVAAEQTSEAVGDGTSTATILAHAIFSEGLRNIAAGASAVDLKRGLDRGVRAVVQEIRQIAKPITCRREKAQIATISAHNNPQLGNLLADAMERVGNEGVVSVEEAKGTETTLEIVEGMQFDRGFLSPYFVTDPAKMEAVLESPLILLVEKKISALKSLLPILEQIAKTGSPLLIIADDVENEALATLVVNRMRGVLNCIAVQAPGFGGRRKALMEDIACLCGGQYFAAEMGIDLASIQLKDLGRADRVVINKDSTTIVGGKGDSQTISGRCEEIRRMIHDTTSDYDREKLNERLAKLSGGVALIRVGAPSEVEMKALKEAMEDAICATRAAIAEGVVPGGGYAYLHAIDAVESLVAQSQGDEQTGLRILRRALEAPTRQIAENSGADGGVIVAQMRSSKLNHGFDALTGEYVDLVVAGIIDPAKVLRLALENAVSVASVLLLTEVTMTEVPEADRAASDQPSP